MAKSFGLPVRGSDGELSLWQERATEFLFPEHDSVADTSHLCSFPISGLADSVVRREVLTVGPQSHADICSTSFFQFLTFFLILFI